MRRLPILLALALVFALFVVASAMAVPPGSVCDKNPEHWSCTTTTPPPTTTITTPPQPEACVFDEVSGELLGWPENGEGYRCKWTPDNAAATYSFQIQSDTVETVKLPQLTVNAEPWTPSAVCFNEWRSRPQDVPFPPDGDPLWTFAPALSSWWPPADGGVTCAEGGPYLLAIRVNPVKTGTVKLVISPPAVIPPITQWP